MRQGFKGVSIAACCAMLSGCSIFMEANRPTPVDLSKFKVGQNRLDVVAELGVPTASVKNGTDSCDVYKLYTRGPGGFGKGAIATSEAVADVMTLGLTEIIFTPVESATKNSRHTVVICYGPNNKLTGLRESTGAAE